VTIRPKFGRTSVKIRRHLRLCFRGILQSRWRELEATVLTISYQLVTNLPVDVQLLYDDDDVQ